jgi:hypothetical protein
VGEGRESGQAQLELIGGLPLLALAAVVALQLLAVGYAQSLADGAAEAGAAARVAGLDARDAARAALPEWARERASIEVRGGRIAVRLRPPAPLRSVSEPLTGDSVAWARPDREGR